MKITTHIFNTLKNVPATFAALLIAVNLSISCASVNGHLKYAHRGNSEIPADAFAYVMVSKIATAEECIEADDIDACNELISFLPPIVINGSGSGLLMWAKNKPVVMTAEHVCTSTNFPEYHEQDGMKIRVRSETVIEYRIHTGETLSAKIIALDPIADLCALSVEKIYAPPVRIARKAPTVGDDVFVVSAPYGINAPSMTLVFSGHYSGYDSNMHFYTLPTRPGSSGSVILDSEFRAVGVTSAAFTDIESIAMGPGHEELEAFIDIIMMNE